MHQQISRLHAAAVAYAEAGIPVFPCVVGGKQPATLRGFKDRTTDRSLIDEWWLRNPYNIAIVPDDAGWIVVDIDPKHEGNQTWTQFESKCPKTRTIITPSGGRHLYLYGSGQSTSGRIGPGVDTRGRLGYVLIPPSIVNGVEYREL